MTEIDYELHRLLVSLKSCDCYPNQSEDEKDRKESINLLVEYLKERDEIFDGLRHCKFLRQFL